MYHLLLCLFKWLLPLLSRSFPRPVCTLSFVTSPDLKFQGQGHSWSVPIIPMILSIHLWAIIISQMCFNWSYYTLLTSLPTYMDNILHFDLKSVSAGSISFSHLCLTVGSVRCSNVPTLLCVSVQNGFLSALPYLAACLVANASGFVADFVIARRVFSLTVTRKIFTLAGKVDFYEGLYCYKVDLFL